MSIHAVPIVLALLMVSTVAQAGPDAGPDAASAVAFAAQPAALVPARKSTTVLKGNFHAVRTSPGKSAGKDRPPPPRARLKGVAAKVRKTTTGKQPSEANARWRRTRETSAP